MRCRSCGEDVGESDRFCNACGARVADETRPAAPPSSTLPPPPPPADSTDNGTSTEPDGTPIRGSGAAAESTSHDIEPDEAAADDDAPSEPANDAGAPAFGVAGTDGVELGHTDPSDDRDQTGEMALPSLYDFADEPDPQITNQLAAMASGQAVPDDATTVIPSTAPAADPNAPTTATPATAPTTDDATTSLPEAAEVTTAESTAVIPSTRRQTTGQVPETYRPAASAQWLADDADDGEVAESHRFRFRLTLITSLLAAIAGAAAASATVIDVTTDASSLQYLTGVWKVNDFGTNSTVGMAIAAAVMVIGSIASCFGYRWGGGLAGGAGLALAGWAALLIGLAEVPLAQVDTAIVNATEEFRVEMTRDAGYFLVAAAGALGVVTFLVSLSSMRRDRATSLNPWVAALGAAATLVAAAGPLLPEKTGSIENNWSSIDGPIDFPTLFFAGRLAQLGLLGLTGLIGFLLVRRYGLGLAAGGFIVVGWYAVTALLEQTDAPIGPANGNPGAFDTVDPSDVVPHAMTIGGLAVALFCLVMAGFEVALSRSPSDDSR